MKNVVIIDYEGSNLFSVMRALEHLGVGVQVSNSPNLLAEADAAVLPGVGAYGSAMERLRALELIPVVQKFIASNRPFLGICLGMQLLFTQSEEFGVQQGLNIFPGKVKRFPSEDLSKNKVSVPQIGWNKVRRPSNCNSWSDTPLSEVPDGSFMYFVHSFYCLPQDLNSTTSITTYGGIEYCSSLRSGNTFASQFHPEKSATLGLSIYKNWAIQSGIL